MRKLDKRIEETSSDVRYSAVCSCGNKSQYYKKDQFAAILPYVPPDATNTLSQCYRICRIMFHKILPSEEEEADGGGGEPPEEVFCWR